MSNATDNPAVELQFAGQLIQAWEMTHLIALEAMAESSPEFKAAFVERMGQLLSGPLPSPASAMQLMAIRDAVRDL